MEDNVGWTGGNVDDASENALIFTDRKPFRESKARYDETKEKSSQKISLMFSYNELEM